MILPTFILLNSINQRFNETGLDCLDSCLDPAHWRSYPHYIEYIYNSRGYRDAEWPEDLSDVVWCFGDSFTAGVGVPYAHIWPQVLQQQLNQRTINVSMDGASNNWIARKISELSSELQPRRVVIHWSYASRRENVNETELLQNINAKWSSFYQNIKDQSWPTCDKLIDFDLLPGYVQQEIIEQHATEYDRLFIDMRFEPYAAPMDESRRMHYAKNLEDNTDNTIECIKQVHQCLPDTDIVHSFIPEFDIDCDKATVLDYLKNHNYKFVEPLERLDTARDGHHYDIVTAKHFCQKLVKLI